MVLGDGQLVLGLVQFTLEGIHGADVEVVAQTASALRCLGLIAPLVIIVVAEFLIEFYKIIESLFGLVHSSDISRRYL